MSGTRKRDQTSTFAEGCAFSLGLCSVGGADRLPRKSRRTTAEFALNAKANTLLRSLPDRVDRGGTSISLRGQEVTR